MLVPDQTDNTLILWIEVCLSAAPRKRSKVILRVVGYNRSSAIGEGVIAGRSLRLTHHSQLTRGRGGFSYSFKGSRFVVAGDGCLVHCSRIVYAWLFPNLNVIEEIFWKVPKFWHSTWSIVSLWHPVSCFIEGVGGQRSFISLSFSCFIVFVQSHGVRSVALVRVFVRWGYWFIWWVHSNSIRARVIVEQLYALLTFATCQTDLRIVGPRIQLLLLGCHLSGVWHDLRVHLSSLDNLFLCVIDLRGWLYAFRRFLLSGR